MNKTAPPILALAALAACRPPDSAPTELDELAHFFFAQVHEQEQDRILEGALNLASWFDDNGLAGPGADSGTISDLSSAEVQALAEMTWQPDPSLAVGVFAVSSVACSLEDAEAINLEEDQLALFPGSYNSYERSWDSDPDCYADGSCDAVDWTGDIEDGFVGSLGSMSYQMVVKMRRSRDVDGQPAAMLVRSVMPAAASEDYDSGGFEQSFHVGVYVPYGAGTLHLSSLWSYGWTSIGNPDDDFWANQYVGGLLDFEDNLEELCTEGW
jgi:hypothetical protein